MLLLRKIVPVVVALGLITLVTAEDSFFNPFPSPKAEYEIPFIVEKPRPQTEERTLSAQVTRVVDEGDKGYYVVTLTLSRPTHVLNVLIYDKTQTFIVDHTLKTHYRMTSAVRVGDTRITLTVFGPKPPGDHFGIVEVAY